MPKCFRPDSGKLNLLPTSACFLYEWVDLRPEWGCFLGDLKSDRLEVPQDMGARVCSVVRNSNVDVEQTASRAAS